MTTKKPIKLQELTRDEVIYIMPRADKRVDRFLPYLNKYAQIYQVDTTLRMAHFLAQIAHESGELLYKREIASGMKYEGRKDLGNVVKGDGPKFKGRGLIQVTGRYNYSLISKDLDVDFVAHPELLEEDEYAVASAFWFWDRNRLNTYADNDDVVTITKRINGGTNHLKERKEYLERAKKVFKI